METRPRYTYQKSPTPPLSFTSPPVLWTGRLLSLVPALFLLLGAGMNLLKPAPVVEATLKMGFPEWSITFLGIVLLTSTILYLIPRTAVLGAVLLTGYLGGAVATHVRNNDPVFSLLLPVLFGAALWGGLWLRDSRLRALMPVKSS